ncbi:MAG: asparagine synthase (glutamine-hydrolyzing) [Acidobacteriota bacterium]|nr:asparagine synthase (glutamine-hydrolyzing) [Acidobacteriota bacterium]
MCGLCGIAFNDRSYLPSERQLTGMRDSLAHRGPDDAGNFIAPGIALGSRRLAIVDLSPRGHMPMASEDGRYHIAYNGEVYNYRELRPALEARGFQFRSNTDTEVLLNLYRAEGSAMLDKLNGMFAIAIWDEQEKSLFIARDRLGIKPLYYAERPEGLYFASEEKALFTAGVPAEFDQSCWEELLCFRYVAGERTPFAGVKRLLPGHYLTWKNGQLAIKRWWNLAERAMELRESLPSDPVDWFRVTFDSAVSLRRISDVPVGVLLSGGLDSSSVAASLALQAGEGISTFTVRFDEAAYDEGPLAQQLAAQYRLDYRELRVKDDDLLSRIEQASWFNDEPLAHGNDIHLLAISEFAKSRVTVLLSGEGADETLGGYVRYKPLQHPMLLNAARPVLPGVSSAFKLSGRLDKLARFLKLGATDRMVFFNSCDLLPHELDVLAEPARQTFEYRESVLAEAQKLYPNDFVRQAMYNDQHTFLCSVLDRNDRTTMGASIECRVPFLDYRLVEGLAALPSEKLLSKQESKHVLRKAVEDRLPTEIRSHRKWGFGVPWKTYFRQQPDFHQFIRQLPDHEALRNAPFVPERLRQTAKAFLEGDDRHEPLIRQLVMVALWRQSYFARLNANRFRTAPVAAD